MATPLRDIISGIIDISENTTSKLFGGIIKRIEKSFWKTVRSFIDDFDSKDGLFQDSTNNEELLIEIGKKLEDGYFDSGIKNAVDQYLQEVNIQEKLTKEFYRLTLKAGDQKDLTKLFRDTRVFKTQLIDKITSSLLNKTTIQANLISQLRDELFNAIVFNESVSKTKKKLRDLIVTREGSNSRILKYVGQISQDGIGQYQGAIQDKIRTEYDLDGFAYLGTEDDDSRCNCVNLRCNTGNPKFYGKFDDLKLPNAKGFRVADLEEIVRRMKRDDFPNNRRPIGKDGKRNKYPKGNEGLNPELNVSNFARIRGGYNCLDSVVYFRILDEDIENPELREELVG